MIRRRGSGPYEEWGNRGLPPAAIEGGRVIWTGVAMINLPTFLPGVFALVPGTKADFFSLCRFHYLPDPPATFAQIWAITYADSGCYSGGGDGWACGPTAKRQAARSAGSNSDPDYAASGCSPRAVAVATVSYPTPRNRGREHFFGTAGWRYREQILFANANLRTLSRLIIHPQFRSLGLATALTRHCCLHTPTRYTESLAVMGRAHPFFERAGMKRIDPPGAPEDAPLYFIHDKGPEWPMTNSEFPNEEAMPNAKCPMTNESPPPPSSFAIA